jgi:hypothetical protein
MAEPWIGDTGPCPDPECSGGLEPEQDGDTAYWACNVCGYETYGSQPAPAAGCQLGIPEDVRREAAGPVFVGQIGRRPG